MLRFHLPPNFAAAASRDAVAIRVELDLAVAPPTEFLPALALLQRWCGAGTPPKFVQLSRAQLRELATAASGLPVFVEQGQATAWRHDSLVADVKATAPNSAPPGSLRRSTKIGSPKSVLASLIVDGSEHFLALMLPSREHPSYADALALVKEHGFTLEPSNRKWWLRDRHKTLNFLASHSARLRNEFEAQLTPA